MFDRNTPSTALSEESEILQTSRSYAPYRAVPSTPPAMARASTLPTFRASKTIPQYRKLVFTMDQFFYMNDEEKMPSTDAYTLSGDEYIDYNSLCVVYALTLVAEGARGLILPTVWPYFQSKGGEKSALGFLVASYPLGRVMSTIPLGYLADSLSPTIVLIIASLLQAFGHLLYAIAPSTQYLFIGRVLVGFGSATSSVGRAHLARAIPFARRTQHFAYLCCLQFVGLAGLPILGGLLNAVPAINPKQPFFVPLNGFTYPALVLLAANLLCIWLISKYYVAPENPGNEQAEADDEEQPNSAPTTVPTQSPDMIALVAVLSFNVLFRGVLAQLETVTVPFLLERFEVSASTASVCVSAFGAFGILVYLMFRTLTRRFSDRRLVGGGLFLMALSVLPLTANFLEAKLPMVIYLVFLGSAWSIAYPIGQTATVSLFSKLLAGLNAGSLFGVMSATGSGVPMVLAAISSALWEAYGRSAVFMLSLVATAMAFFAFLRLFDRFKPPVVLK